MTERLRKRRRGWMIAGGVLAAIVLVLGLTGIGGALLAMAVAILEDCPGTTRHARLDAPFFVIGHRGAAGAAVENTLPSMAEAMRQGANAVEIDLSMTADGRIVLWHDWDPDDPVAAIREQGKEPDVLYRPVFPEEESGFRRMAHTLTLAELRTHFGYAPKDSEEAGRVPAEIPTLDQFLDWAVGQQALRAVVFDIKIPEEQAPLAGPMLGRIDSTLKAHGTGFRSIFLTPHPAVLAEIERTHPALQVSFDLEPTGAIIEPCENNSARLAVRYGNGYASTVSPTGTTLAPWTTLKRLVECDVAVRDSLNATGPAQPIDAVIVSTINEEEKIGCLLGIGVDGIITDFPERLLRVVNATGFGNRVSGIGYRK